MYTCGHAYVYMWTCICKYVKYECMWTEICTDVKCVHMWTKICMYVQHVYVSNMDIYIYMWTNICMVYMLNMYICGHRYVYMLNIYRCEICIQVDKDRDIDIY